MIVPPKNRFSQRHTFAAEMRHAALYATEIRHAALYMFSNGLTPVDWMQQNSEK